ncbi:MAG: ATP-binding protein [Spirochaetaceae bacterium]
MHYTLCDYVLDVFQNALEAGSQYTEVDWAEAVSAAGAGSAPGVDAGTSVADAAAYGAAPPHIVAVTVRDAGHGMTEEQRRRAMDPFQTDGIKHPERHVGLGLPFLAHVVEATGGTLTVESEVGKGTTVAFEVDVSNIDAPPVGDVPGTFLQMFCFEGDYEVVVRRSRRVATSGGGAPGMGDDVRSYELSRHELREALGDLETTASLSLLQQFLVQHEAVLHGVEV